MSDHEDCHPDRVRGNGSLERDEEHPADRQAKVECVIRLSARKGNYVNVSQATNRQNEEIESRVEPQKQPQVELC